jgi:hypothetical protein
MLIICVCTSERKIWIAPYEDIKHIKKLNISSRSKYNKYLVKDNIKLKDERITGIVLNDIGLYN